MEEIKNPNSDLSSEFKLKMNRKMRCKIPLNQRKRYFKKTLLPYINGR